MSLEVRDLSVRIGGRTIIDRVDLNLAKGETLGIVGESGSGKSITALALMGLLPPGTEADGRVTLDGRDLRTLTDDEMSSVRGDRMSMVFQEPMSALNPVSTIGSQIAEVMLLHRDWSRAEIGDRVREQLVAVGLSTITPDRYPHELSGGQRQRVLIAIATTLVPSVLVADEPTTALDAVLQTEMLDLLQTDVREGASGLLLITHDLAVVADRCDRVAILDRGVIVETGVTSAVLHDPQHPYTQKLARASAYRPSRKSAASPRRTLLQATGLTRGFRLPQTKLFGARRTVEAVIDVDLQIEAGRTLGLVGKSGCGKSTLARLLVGLDRPDDGTLQLHGRAVDLSKDRSPAYRRAVQMVFQDPFGSFDPRYTAERIVAEPLYLLPALTTTERNERVALAFERVGLTTDMLARRPHQFSGGQRQRLAIARALIVEPDLIVADEPVSALDVSTRGRILDLFVELQERLGLALVFISHDLALVEAICDDVAIMRAGRIVERGAASAVFANPSHEYTAQLLAARPAMLTHPAEDVY